MERDPSEREALRRKAEEARALLRKEQEDEDGMINVSGRPKFAPPVKSLKQDVFGEKLKSSLGPFEVVAPLLVTLKNRSIYGVAPCPQTPVSTSTKPSFPLDLTDAQPSTSSSSDIGDSSKRNGSNTSFVAPTSSRRPWPETTSNGRSRSPSNNNNDRKRQNGEWTDRSDHRSINRNAKGDRYDHHNHSSSSSSQYRRSNEDQQSSKKDQSQRTDQNRRSDHYQQIDNAGDHRRRQDDSTMVDSQSKRSSSSSSSSIRGDERYRNSSEKSSISTSSTSSSKIGGNKSNSGGGRHDRRNPSESSRKRSRSRSPQRSESNLNSVQKSKTGSSTTLMDAGDKAMVPKRDQPQSESNSKKHGQTSLRLEGLSSMRLGTQKDTTVGNEIPSTPLVEKMIKSVTGIVQEPPLSSIPAADPTELPFSYPVKVEETKKAVVTKTVSLERKGDSESSKKHKDTSAQKPVENGFGKRTTLDDDLLMSESDGDDSDSDSAISDKEPETMDDAHKVRTRPDEHSNVNGMSGDKPRSDRASSTSPKKEEPKVASPVKTEPKQPPEPFTWSITSLLNAMTPQPAASSASCTSDPTPSTSKQQQHQQPPPPSKSKQRHTGQTSSKKKGEDDEERTPKISIKLTTGKVQMLNADKLDDSSSTSKQKRSKLDEFKSKKQPKDIAETMEVDEIGVGGHTGKENLKSTSSIIDDDSKSKNGWITSKSIGKLFDDAESILQDARLSPLLSPIHEFPPLQFFEGKPTLLCQIPLNMLDRVPSQKQRPNGRHLPTKKERGDENLIKIEEKKVEAAAAAINNSQHNDLDDVPISERKKRRSVAGPTASILMGIPEEKPSPVKQQPTTTSATPEKSKFRSSKNAGGTASVQSAPTKVQTTAKNNKSASKRKMIDECPPADSPARKTPRLEQETAAPLIFADAPTKPVELDSDFTKEPEYQTKAKDVKHDADSQADRTVRMILYLESVVYFIMTGLCMEKKLIEKNKESNASYTMIKTTVDLLKNVAQKYVCQMSSTSSIAGYVSKVDILSLRIQSMCYYKMFEMRQAQAINNYRQLSDFHKTSSSSSNSAPSSVNHPSSTNGNGNQVQNGGSNGSQHGGGHGGGGGGNSGVTPSPTPSPASSTGSSHSLPPGLVAIPQQIEMLYKQQLSHLHSLMWAHTHWQQGEQRLQTVEDKAFFEHLDKICGTLTLTSDLHHLCSYVLTAVTWLRQMYTNRQHR